MGRGGAARRAVRDVDAARGGKGAAAEMLGASRLAGSWEIQVGTSVGAGRTRESRGATVAARCEAGLLAAILVYL